MTESYPAHTGDARSEDGTTGLDARPRATEDR